MPPPVGAGGYESHCIGGYNGPGPYKLVNNTFSSACIPVIFGGAPTSACELRPGLRGALQVGDLALEGGEGGVVAGVDEDRLVVGLVDDHRVEQTLTLGASTGKR